VAGKHKGLDSQKESGMAIIFPIKSGIIRVSEGWVHTHPHPKPSLSSLVDIMPKRFYHIVDFSSKDLVFK